MTQTQQELERLRTLQESYHDLDDKINVVLPALADKIDNIQLPEIDTTELAKEQTLLDKTEEIKQEVKDLQKIPNEIITLLENRYQFQVNYDGAELNNSGIIQSILGAIINRDAIVTLTDNYVTALPNKKLTELGFTSLKKASFNKVSSIAGSILWGTKVENLSLPVLKSFGFQNFRDCAYIKTINLPALEDSGEINSAVFYNTKNLIDIICGANFRRSQFGFGGSNYGWNPTEAMRDDVDTLVTNQQDEFGNAIDNNRKQLLYNLRRNMAANLPQLTTEGYTIAFTPQMKEIIEADENTKAAFINKGWTIS